MPTAMNMIRPLQSAKTYQPKGGMCTSCEKLGKDCSSLKFEGMPIIGTNQITGAKIVICTEHERKMKQ